MESKISIYYRTIRVKEASRHVLTTLFSIMFLFLIGYLPSSITQILQITLITWLSSLYCFCSNNFFDKEIDAKNPKKKMMNPYSAGKVSTAEIVTINTIFIILMLALTYFWFPNLLGYIFGIIIFMSLYSTTFKKIPIIDLFAHATLFFSFFLLPALVLGVPTITILLSSLWFLGLSNISNLNRNQLRDYKEDKKAGVKTTAVFFGLKTTKTIMIISAIIVVLSTIIGSVLFNNYLILLFSLPLLSFFAPKDQ